MDHSTRVFASVFPVLSLSHTTPTPIATPDLGYTAPGSSFGSPFTGRVQDAQGQGQHRVVKRSLAWSYATRFLSLPKDITVVPRLQRTREVEEALTYLLLGEGQSEHNNEESLVDWYTNECRLHFVGNVASGLDEIWKHEVELQDSWELLEETCRIFHRVWTVYSQPFDEHLIPFIQRGSGHTTNRPSRPTQAADTAAANNASTKFGRDIHAVFAHSLPLQRYSKTLSYVLYDAGCRLFRIYTRKDGIKSNPEPESMQTLRQRTTTLLQSLVRVGLGGDTAQKAFAHTMNTLLDSFIASHYVKVDWFSKKSIVPHLRLWIRDGFAPLIELVLECLQCKPSTIVSTEVSSWQEMALSRLGRARVDDLFDFVINWDKSLGAFKDIKEYLKLPGAKPYLTSSFAGQISRRLLHPGATTTFILNVYILIIRSFHVLEPKGVLLERVARPIRRYLKDRDDTGRIIISSLLTDVKDENKFSANSELSYEIASEMAKPFASFGQDADEELNWNDMSWQPLPQDASPEYKKSKVEDVIWFLLTLWEREDFINELKNIYGDHLLRCQDPEYIKEIRLLELIKIRLGDEKLQACEVMLNDVLESKRINAAVHANADKPALVKLITPDDRNKQTRTPDGRNPRTPQPRRSTRATAQLLPPTTPKASVESGPTINAQILSSFFWPMLRDDTFRVPAEIDVLQKAYESRFESIKGMRKLRWMNALGESSITLDFDDRSETFEHLTPWQVSVIYAFQPSPSEAAAATKSAAKGKSKKAVAVIISKTVSELEDTLEMDEQLVRQALSFWTGKSVLRASPSDPDTYSVIERASSADADAAAAAQELATLQSEATTTAVKSQQDLLSEKKDVYELFILGMLRNQGNMKPDRIAMMMRMMVQGGFPFGAEEVGMLLGQMEGEGKVVALGGGVWGIRK